MIRKLIAIVLALVAGFTVILIIEGSNHLANPAPQEVLDGDQEALADYYKTMPNGALMTVLFAHSLGAFIAGIVCNIISKGPWVFGVVVVGQCMLVGAMINLWWIPHKEWFEFADPLVFFPSIFLGAGIVEFFFGGKKNRQEE